MKLFQNQKLKLTLVTLVPLLLVLFAWGRLQNPGSLPDAIAPQSIEAKTEIGEIIKNAVLALNNGQGDRAIVLLEDAVVKYPEQMDLQLHLGMAYRKTKKFLQADKVYKKLLLKYPECLPCKNNDAVNLIQMTKTQEALDLLTEVLKQDSTYLDAQLNLGIAYEKNGQILQAISAYQQYLKMISTNDSRPEPAMARERIRHLEEGL
ncbi:MAG: tetratricopeptide repeat protein [Deltaproteobacteria bacterium]|nr:tetratricopeptide repeat protein [Deltaproteobacteria bacterium]